MAKEQVVQDIDSEFNWWTILNMYHYKKIFKNKNISWYADIDHNHIVFIIFRNIIIDIEKTFSLWMYFFEMIIQYSLKLSLYYILINFIICYCIFIYWYIFKVIYNNKDIFFLLNFFITSKQFYIIKNKYPRKSIW